MKTFQNFVPKLRRGQLNFIRTGYLGLVKAWGIAPRLIFSSVCKLRELKLCTGVVTRKFYLKIMFACHGLVDGVIIDFRSILGMISNSTLITFKFCTEGYFRCCSQIFIKILLKCHFDVRILRFPQIYSILLLRPLWKNAFHGNK